MPLLGSNTTKCFHASATGHEAQSAICPGLTMRCLPKDGPHSPPQAVQTCKVLWPYTTFSSHDAHIILMTAKLGQRLRSVCLRMVLQNLWSTKGLEKVWGVTRTPPTKNHHCHLASLVWTRFCHIILQPLRRPLGGAEDPLISEKQDCY